jgi:hypothetical protein
MSKQSTSTPEPPAPDLEMRVIQTAQLESEDRERVHRLFDRTYTRANHAYLDKSLSKLRTIALAADRELLVGFGVADTIETRLPRLEEPQIVMLAGICCVDPAFRRAGLFKRLEILAAEANGLLGQGRRVLLCGRMAHPVSYRTMLRFPSVVPKVGVPLSEWHKEVGLRVSELYGSRLDPETFVVLGEGTPIGYPNLACEVSDQEWLPFRSVNRDRGDALLGIFWAPDAPEGWEEGDVSTVRRLLKNSHLRRSASSLVVQRTESTPHSSGFCLPCIWNFLNSLRQALFQRPIRRLAVC